ncbi:hypothetical protein EUX98_g2081 [Antrodiella citrinella]|uniref:GID complex catalytic subunit 2 n=1 Tax=Antrodiella citrinella TaxID=2447956 RepID=A0A4V3XJA2_9APHY|nr:hypothetical protein EUX98_g2081 [Antrodiella citrinella]
MDASLKELAKLEKLVSNSNGAGKGKSLSISDSLDSLLVSLRDAKGRIQSGADSADTYTTLSKTVVSTRKDVDERQKEVYNSLARYGKALDKRFTVPLPSYSPLFASAESVAALERTIAQHFLRTGQFRTAEVFVEESGINVSPELQDNFAELHEIISSLRQNDIGPALEWAECNRSFLLFRSSPLEFYLHRSQYMRLLLANNDQAALIYAQTNLQRFYDGHAPEIQRLMNCMVFLPPSRLRGSPYADLTHPSLHSDLEPMFAKEYCANLGMSRQVPLRVVGDIGGGGALARIEKGRKVMRERKSEWSQADELPIEIPLGPENRYHSIFACPVSKEQSTEQNPPMMMSCGHVITRDSLQKLSKPGGHVKCPYCPQESQVSHALRVHF